jgi:outer membrane receptor for ferrienterochelin and colicin
MKSLRNLFFVFALIAIPVFSQELTSDISGTVSSADGSLSGAEITITYEPTNTTITRTTNSSGRYFAGGLRPGGPYKISVSATGLLTQNETTSLVVGETQRVSFSLNSAESAEEVVVTGSRITVDRDGFTTVIDSERIATIPSVTRDLKDILRLNPLITLDDEEDGEESISIGGAHPRTNDIRVDGVSFNDDFGLNDNGYPSQRSPINFGSIEQIAVKVAPASVEYAQFRGGVIDIITKGGTNEFTGDFAYFDRGDSFMGDKLEGEDIDITKEDTAYEFALGGPIIQDKLFFYVTYSEAEISNPLRYGIQGSGAENILDVTADQAAQVRNSIKNLIGLDPFGPTGATESLQENTSVRLDWNISDKHRLTFNHKDVFGTDLKALHLEEILWHFIQQDT